MFYKLAWAWAWVYIVVVVVVVVVVIVVVVVVVLVAQLTVHLRHVVVAADDREGRPQGLRKQKVERTRYNYK